DQQIELTVMELVTRAQIVPEEPVFEAPLVPVEMATPQTVATLSDDEIAFEPVHDVAPRLEPWQLARDTENAADLPVYYEEEMAEEFGAEPDPWLVPDDTLDATHEPEIVSPPDAAIATHSSVARQVARVVLICSVLVVMFDERPAQIGHAVGPIFETAIRLAPFGSQGFDPPSDF
ncbi:hypothetical protein N9M66_03305, partial [Litoreibacter sp.]|nr:hypothetical protein [Litoreibacter sp.]